MTISTSVVPPTTTTMIDSAVAWPSEIYKRVETLARHV